MAGLILIVLAGLAIWWVEKHPDLDDGIGIMVFGLSWVMAMTGIYVTLKQFWV